MALDRESLVSEVFGDEDPGVLVVEDNPADADLLAEYLSAIPDYDFELEHVSRLEDGFNAAQNSPPDFLFLDLNLPDAAAEETVRSIGQFPRETAIIVLTGKAEPDLELAALARGAEEVIEKGTFGESELARCIAHAVERNRLVEQIRSREEKLRRYETVIKETPELVTMKDREGRYALVNPAFQEFADVDAEEVVGKTAVEAFGEELGGAAKARDAKVLESGTPSRGEETYHIHGEERTLYMMRLPYQADGEVRGVITMARDITEEKALRNRLEQQLLRDELTNLPNRALFRDRLAQVVERARRRGERFGVALVDIDNFAAVNDSLGHAVGDEVLCAVGRRISSVLQSEDTVARLGADEFGCVLTEACEAERLDELAHELSEAFEDPFTADGSEVHLTISIGYAYADEPAELGSPSEDEIDALVRTATRAKLDAKNAPGTSWRIYERSEWGEGSQRIQRANRIRRALEKDEFVPFFQPIYRLDNDELMALEVLARWDRPGDGIVSPAKFIPLAEETGLIARLGEELLETACRQLTEFLREGDAERRFALFVNLSPRQLDRQDAVDRLIELSAEESPERIDIGFEVTETAILKHRSNALHLRENGHDIWVDDFGTGYSSLARLKNIPVDGLKLDMEFVHGVTEESHDAAIAYTVAELGRRMGVPVIAEGVETEGQHEFVGNADCTAAQGYLYAHPQPIQNIGVLFDS